MVSIKPFDLPGLNLNANTDHVGLPPLANQRTDTHDTGLKDTIIPTVGSPSSRTSASGLSVNAMLYRPKTSRTAGCVLPLKPLARTHEKLLNAYKTAYIRRLKSRTRETWNLIDGVPPESNVGYTPYPVSMQTQVQGLIPSQEFYMMPMVQPFAGYVPTAAQCYYGSYQYYPTAMQMPPERMYPPFPNNQGVYTSPPPTPWNAK